MVRTAAEPGKFRDDGITINHLNFKRLMRRLSIPLFQAVGLVTTLSQITTESAADGDIGRFSNADIAVALEWEHDADALIDAFVECGWIDRDNERRLVICDWCSAGGDR